MRKKRGNRETDRIEKKKKVTEEIKMVITV